MRITLLLAAVIAAGSARAEEQTFLFDVLRLPKFHMSWDRLIKDVQPTPDWLLHFTHNFDGAAGEMKSVTIGGKPYKLSYVCKPEDCAAHRFEVLFDAEGMRAFGALGGKDEPPAFFGGPDPAMQEAMTQALQPGANHAGADQSKSE